MAKLNGQSCSLKFICTLQGIGVKFVTCNMPEANKFTVSYIGTLGHGERKLVSEREKAALDAKRKRAALDGRFPKGQLHGRGAEQGRNNESQAF